MRPFVVCVAVVLALAGCTSSTGLDLRQTDALNQHQSQWTHSDPHSYSFVYAFHNLGDQSTVRITVRNDAVSSVVDDSTGAAADPQYPWPTIDQLFAIARDGLDSKGVVVEFQFDPQYGFPSELSVGSRVNTPGGSYGSTVSNFQPLD